MKGNSIKWGVFQPSALKVDSISDAVVADVLGYLFFILLIDEDKPIVFRVSSIVEHPLFS